MNLTGTTKAKAFSLYNCPRFLLYICMLLTGIPFAHAGIASDTSHAKAKTRKTVILKTATADPKIEKCKDISVIRTIIGEAIDVGAPTYNEGNITGCYRIYEGAAYKIIYKYGSKNKEVKTILETALEKSYGDYTATEKAWIMRMAFDTILGEPTTTTTK